VYILLARQCFLKVLQAMVIIYLKKDVNFALAIVNLLIFLVDTFNVSVCFALIQFLWQLFVGFLSKSPERAGPDFSSVVVRYKTR
jgi:hypothetical protein